MGKTLKSIPQSKQEHPFVEPRFVAAGGLIGLGIAVGWGLMFAKILVLLGLIIALASALAVISIYSKHFRNIYRALSKKQKYNGPGIIELLVAVVMLTVVIVVSPIIYFSVQADELILNRAEMRLAGITPYKLPGFANYLVNVAWLNRGTLTMINGEVLLKGWIANTIDRQRIDTELESLALLWQIWLKAACEQHLTVRASSWWRPHEEVEDGLSDGRHARLWRWT